MTTTVIIENKDGPGAVLVENGFGNTVALLPEEKLEVTICQDFTISINEADLLSK